MTRSAVITFAALLLAGCATSSGKTPPVCDGRHLRPANPYGSVLNPIAPASPAAGSPEKAAPKAPKSSQPSTGGLGGVAPGGCGS